jgi:hypothetical protein
MPFEQKIRERLGVYTSLGILAQAAPVTIPMPNYSHPFGYAAQPLQPNVTV